MRIRPTLQITIGLVVLTSAILLIIDLLFGVFADPEGEVMRVRKASAETMATQVAVLIESGQLKALSRMLDRIRKQNPAIRSLAVRRTEGRLLAQSGDHAAAWQATNGDTSTLAQLLVPLSTDSGRWGSFEVAYFPDGRSWLDRALGHRLGVALFVTALLGAFVYFQYMRRALVHLDPKAVIPERVKLAFDIMTEGVAVLDRRGRVLLANRALCALPGGEPPDLLGKRLSALPWLEAALPLDRAARPWEQAIHSGSPVMGHAIDVAFLANGGKKLVINCAPIADPRGVVRGCVVTFADFTALHRANEQLSQALADLSASRDEIARKNVELEHVATHDALTKCLTRGAFFERLSQARLDALRNSSPLCCLALDIDRFKAVNDSFGHTVGDRVIQEVGKTLVASLRAADIAGRYGGDEFFVGMLRCDLDQGLAVAEKIRDAIEQQCNTAFRDITGLRVTVSIGIAALRDGDDDLADLIDRADGALYDAKANGRNRVATARSRRAFAS